MRNIIIIIIFISLSKLLMAQSTELKSNISGRIIDLETQQPLPFANVWINGTTIGTTSNENGEYAISNVVVGRYTLSASMVGYEQAILPDITVVPKRTTIVNISLKQSISQINEVVVRPDYYNLPDEMSINSITSISGEEIKHTPGIPDMFRRLQAVAGVNKQADNSPVLIVRGGAPDENLTIIENIEIYSPYHFSSLSGGMAEGVSIIQPKIINDVTFITGGFSSQYGDKLSSVTEIQLQQPSKNRINTDITLDIGGFGAVASGPLTKKSSWMLSGRRSIYDLMLKMRGKNYSPRTTDIHAKYIFKPNNKNRFTLYGLYVSDNLEREKSDDDIGLDQLKYRNVTKSIYALGMTWKYLYARNGYLQITPYLNMNNWQLTEGRIKEIDDIGQVNEENFYGVDAFAAYRFNKRHRTIFGGKIKWVNTSYEKWSKGDTLITGILQPAYSIQFGPLTSYKSAAYFHHYYSPISWLKLNAGIRFDYFNFIRDLSINPRLGMRVKLTDKLNINASYGIYSQFPPFYKIFLDSRNSELETSKSAHIIAGTEYLVTKDLQIKIEGFYKDLKNLPYSLTDTSKLFTSSGIGNAKGVEFTLTKKLSKELYILLNYTYCKSARKENKNSQEYDFDYDSPHVFNLMSTYKLRKWWDFSFTCRYSTGLPYTPYDLTTRYQLNGKWFCEKGEINSDRLPDYFRMDIRIDRRFIFKDFNISAFAEVWNLTNHENVMSYEYSEDFLDKEPVTLFSMMPMIGLNFEF
jgi:outer membrane receptor protein involved in Fe transport